MAHPKLSKALSFTLEHIPTTLNVYISNLLQTRVSINDWSLHIYTGIFVFTDLWIHSTIDIHGSQDHSWGNTPFVNAYYHLHDNQCWIVYNATHTAMVTSPTRWVHLHFCKDVVPRPCTTRNGAKDIVLLVNGSRYWGCRAVFSVLIVEFNNISLYPTVQSTTPVCLKHVSPWRLTESAFQSVLPMQTGPSWEKLSSPSMQQKRREGLCISALQRCFSYVNDVALRINNMP